MLNVSLKPSTLMLAAWLLPTIVNAHGFMESPKARQAICQAQGGYWWPEDGSNIPNLACRAAFLQAGHVQFIQEHEFSVNTADYHNIDAVKNNIVDGRLCAAGDHEKRGMDLPSKHWQKTQVTPNAEGQIQVRFLATTPHNPSFWQFYLSKADFDVTNQALSWDDLELIDQHGNIEFFKAPNGNRYYEMSVQLPPDRSGDAILYTRWQRDDVAGEGFYNCSDIQIQADFQVNEWFELGYYVKTGQQPQVNETIWFRLFDSSGQEIINEHLLVTEENQISWHQVLAKQLQLQYAHIVEVGLKGADGTVEYAQNDVAINKVYATNADYTHVLSIQAQEENTPPIIHPPNTIEMAENSRIDIHLHAFDDQQSELIYNWTIPSAFTMTGGGQNITLASGTVSSDTEYQIYVTVSDGELTSEAGFIVIVNDSAVCCLQPWDANRTYTAGDEVQYAETAYVAKWWNQGEQPDTSAAWQMKQNASNKSWNPTQAYQSGSEVVYEGQRYRAKWWNKGEQPGSADVWELI
ncbi:lytic polysaccharide monooxygenase [Catenovulum sediminis]|uniref:lytic polysaccharide monooxygenase n=1 Tax=Catenovulum sediminis TaxID=1740262 RepID=UPI00117D425E|nr:lytic polysaccharide monooxygenase [Catenovulum sediminis]